MSSSKEQINELANFIMAEVEGEPSQSEGAVDTAIRLLRERNALLAVVRLAQEAFGEDGQYGPGALGDALAALPEHLREEAT